MVSSMAESIGKAVPVALPIGVAGERGVIWGLNTGVESRVVCAKKVCEVKAGAEGVASMMEVANGDDGPSSPPPGVELDASPSYTFSEFTAQYESLNASGLFCTKSSQLDALDEHVPS